MDYEIKIQDKLTLRSSHFLSSEKDTIALTASLSAHILYISLLEENLAQS